MVAPAATTVSASIAVVLAVTVPAAIPGTVVRAFLKILQPMYPTQLLIESSWDYF